MELTGKWKMCETVDDYLSSFFFKKTVSIYAKTSFDLCDVFGIQNFRSSLLDDSLHRCRFWFLGTYKYNT